jgi:hypothetical protein
MANVLVKARFFEVAHDGQKTFSRCLAELDDACREAGWLGVGRNLQFHLANLAADRDFICGEFVRRQTADIPPNAPDNAVLIPQLEPIAHRCAFRFLPARSILLMEVRRSALSPNQLVTILHKRCGVRGAVVLPLLRDDGWERLEANEATKFIIRIARPENLEPMDDPDDIMSSLLRFRDATGAPQIEICASRPRGEGRLAMPAIRETLSNLMRQADNDAIKKVQVQLDNEADILDLLEDHVRVAAALELDDGDIQRHYEVRRDYLSQCFDDFLGDANEGGP